MLAIAPSGVTVCAATNSCTTVADGNGIGFAAVADPAPATVTAASAAPSVKSAFMIPPSSGSGSLLERPGELDRERSVVVAEDARELESSLGLGELPGGLQDDGVSGDGERVTALVATAARA